MGDRVALMRRGVLQQVDSPLRLYGKPSNLFVASFIGSPAMNLVEARLERLDDGLAAQIGNQQVRLSPEAMTSPAELDGYVGRTVALGIRPEHLQDAAVATGAPDDRRLAGVVQSVEALGSELIAHVEISGTPVHTDEVKEVAADLDPTMVSELQAEERHARMPLVARFDVASRARPDQPVEVVIDTRRVYLFDLASGKAIGGHPAAVAE